SGGRGERLGARAPELVGGGAEITLDDLHRQCVSRDTARQLFAKRAAAEARRAELQRRHDEELARSAGAPRGVPALPCAPVLESMLAASPPHRPKRRRSVLEHALANDEGLRFLSVTLGQCLKASFVSAAACAVLPVAPIRGCSRWPGGPSRWSRSASAPAVSRCRAWARSSRSWLAVAVSRRDCLGSRRAGRPRRARAR